MMESETEWRLNRMKLEQNEDRVMCILKGERFSSLLVIVVDDLIPF